MSLSARLGKGDRPSLRLSPGQLDARARVVAKLADGTYPLEPAACFCGAAELDLVIAERDRYGLPVRTVLCQHCGLLRTTPRMTASATAQFYEDDYRDLYTGPGNAESLFAGQVARGRGMVRLLAKLLPQLDRVYEIGCGAGGLLLPFAEAGKRVAGVDLGGDYLHVGRAHGMQLVHGDAAALLAATGEPASLVLLIHVLEHYLDLRTAVRETCELVAPGGLLFVEVPGLASIAPSYGGDILRYLQNAHTFHFTGATLAFVLRSCGLEVLVSTDDAMALCRRPLVASEADIVAPAGEAIRNLRTLAELERALLQRHAA
jgi:SAM-dependent methyltransferase